MNTSLAFCTRHTLDSVNASFKLELFVHIFTTQAKHYFFKSTNIAWALANKFSFKTMALSPPNIHSVQVGSEQARFVATGRSADFNNDITVIIRILRA